MNPEIVVEIDLSDILIVVDKVVGFNDSVEVEIDHEDAIVSEDSEGCEVILVIETPEIEIQIEKNQVVNEEFVDLVIEKDEVEIQVEEQVYVGPQGPIGEQGVPGPPGPPGGFEIVPLTLVAGIWTNVPLAIITYVVDVVVYNQVNREKVEIDVRINPDQTVDVRSNSSKTYNVHVSGI